MIKELWIEECGRKRAAKVFYCNVCEEEFIGRVDQERKYCSRSCRSKSKTLENTIEVICAQCGDKTRKRLSSLAGSKHGIYFCSRTCKDKGQKIGGIEAIMPPHYGTSTGGRNSERYRRDYKLLNEVTNLICERCGYHEFECGIDIHHKDEDYNNNVKDNLVALCAPCHRALHSGLWKLGGVA